MKRNVLLLLMLASLAGYAQTTINNYKYVLVPEQFDFLKEANQYNLNARTKFYLEQKGFTAYYDNTQIPKELAADKCNALKAELVLKKGLFVTNLTLLLKDCQGNTVFKSKEGKSREKEWAAAYGEALSEAFTSLNEVPYAYNGTVNTRPQQPVETAAVPAAQPPVTPATAPAPVPAAVKEPDGTLYAQATTNGFQLIDTSPKIVFTLLKTSTPDYFIASKGAAQGIVFKRSGEWFFEYYNDSKLTAEKLLIKF